MRRSKALLRAVLVVSVAVGVSCCHAQSVVLGVAGEAGQQAAPTQGPAQLGGTVSGHVVFADTNGPARFSKVLLKSAAPAGGNDDLLTEMMGTAKKNDSKLSAADQAERKRQLAASAKMLSALSDLMVATTVGADGAYVFTNVKPGTYYVHAIAPGYIDPLADFSAEDFASTDPAMKQKIAAVAVPVTVSGTEQAHADLRLQRGAAISGRVLYDYGTPAVGWTVRTVHPQEGNANAFAAFGLDAADVDMTHLTEAAQTDDTGHFRIAGLQTGAYILQARYQGPALGHSSFNPTVVVSSSGLGSSPMAALLALKLTVYSGNVLRLSEAKPVEVQAGDERSGYDLTMPIHSMHAVGGLVRAKADGHAVNGGSVELTAQRADGKDDPGLRLVAPVLTDGSFHLDYVPGNVTYTVKVTHAVDGTLGTPQRMLGTATEELKPTHRYGTATQTVVVGDNDVTDLRLDVPEQAAAEQGSN